MEDTGQDTTIRIGVDGTGVSAGVTSIKRSLADLGTSVKKISDDTNSELGKIGTGDLKLGKGVEKATKDTIKQTGELLKQLKMVETQAFTGFSNIGKSAEAAYVKLAAASVPENYIASYIKALKEAQSVEAKRVSDAKAAADAIAAANAKAADAAAAIVQKAIADEAHYADLKKQHAAYNQAMAEKSAAALKEELALTNQINEAALRRKYGGSAQSAAYYAEKAGPMAASPNVSSALAGLKAQEEAIRASAEAQKAQQLKILGLNNQIQAARTAAAERVAQETSKIIAIEEHYADLKRQHAAYNKSLADQEIASTKARAAALAAYYAEAQNAELNMIHTGRGKSSAYLIDKGQRLGFTEAEINTAVAGNKKIEASLAAAFAAANPHIGKLKAEAEAAGTSVKGLSASLRNVPAQFTDIVVSLQGGQAPLTVLLQQGGQLRDMFGSTGGAFRALGGYVMGLINPLTLAAGAAATLYMAYRSGASETEAYNKAMINTGNAAGVTASRLAGMAESVSATTGSTIGAAASALAAMTSTSGIAASQFEKVASTAVMMEKVTGVAMADTVKQFAELGKDPVTASEKLNEATHYLTAAVYEQIKALQDQGDKAGAAALAQSAYADAMKQRLPELAENLGYVERAWKGIIGAAKGAWDAMSGLGRQDSTQDRINAINQKLAGKFARSSMWDGGKALDAELAGLQKVLEFDRRIAEQEASKAKSTEASIALSKQAEKSASNEVRLQREIAQARATYAAIKNPSEQDTANYAASVSGLVKSLGEKDKAVRAGAKTISDAEKGLKLYNDLTAAATGLTSDFAEKQALLAAKFGKDGNMAEYQKGMAALIEKQPYMVEAAKAEAEAIKAIDKARTDAIKSHAKELESLGEKAQKLEDEVAMYGMSKEAIEELTTARMLDQIEVLRGFDNSAEEIARIEQVIEARKRLAAAGTAKDIKDGNKKVAEDAAKEWEKYADQIGQSLTDQLMEGGKSGAEYIENLFRTMILRPVIQALVTPIAQSVSSSIMSGGSGGGASGFNIFNSTSGLGDGLSVTLGKTASTLINNGYQQSGEALAGMAKAANTYSSQITMAGNALSYFSAAQSLADGKYGAAAGQAIGTYFGGPIGGSIGNAIGSAIDEAFGGGGGPKSSSAYNTAGVYDSDTSKTSLAATYGRGVEDAWATLAKQLELTTQLKVGTFVSVDSAGSAMTQLATSGTVNGQQIYSRAGRGGGYENVGRSEEALQAALAEEATRLLFAALKASDLPEQYKTYLNTIADSADAMNAAIGNVSLVRNFTKSLQSLPFENLKNLSFDAAKGLIEMAGGLESLTAGMGAYYELFYTDAERIARTADGVSAALAGVGVTMPTTKDAFRAVVDGLNVATESGRATYVAMMALAPAFAQVADAAEKSAQASIKLVTDVFDTLEKRLADLVDSIASERESVAGARDSILNGGPKTYAELQAGIAGAKVALPSDARVLAANAAVAVAAANVAAQNNAVNQARALTPSTAALDAAKAALDAAKAATSVQQAGIDRYMTIEGGRFARWVTQAQAGNDLRGNVPNPSAEYYAQSYVFDKNAAKAAEQPVQAAYDAQLASYNSALAVNAGKVAAAQAVLNAATAAQAAAQASAKAAIMDYAAAMTQYSGDAEKAVKVLGALREQTVAYYEAQKELAGLMTTSAASLREAVLATRFGQLDSAASLAQQQGAFAQNYSLALSTTGATKAGYADKLGAALPGLSAALMDASATRADWALASASLLAQSETIAEQLEADAGGMNYEADSLALLDSIDVALGELDSNTAILKSAIEGGTATTAAGLRAIVSQLGGVPAFASGGYHSGGIRVVGENGPEIEVTGPSRIFNASQLVGAAPDNSALISEIRSLREEVVNLRAEARSSAISNSKTARILERVTPDGSSLQTVAA